MEPTMMELPQLAKVIALSICGIVFVLVVFMDKVSSWLRGSRHLVSKLFGAGKK